MTDFDELTSVYELLTQFLVLAINFCENFQIYGSHLY